MIVLLSTLAGLLLGIGISLFYARTTWYREYYRQTAVVGLLVDTEFLAAFVMAWREGRVRKRPSMDLWQVSLETGVYITADSEESLLNRYRQYHNERMLLKAGLL